MLSTENPPPDPSSFCEISQLKSSDDKPSDNPQLDLLTLGPKFCIRDYVFNNRSKDIKTNWPFSQKNLQLCLKHGVRDLLPPFQSLDDVRNPSSRRCAVENTPVVKENEGILNDVPSRPTNDLVSATSDDVEPILNSVNINSRGFEGDKEFPSMATTQTCLGSNSLSEKSLCVELKADTLPEYSAAKPERKIPPTSNRLEKVVKHPVKKCKVIVKLSNAADQSSKEDTTTNNFLHSETMASKVCPVCKTFTSSSNTTLNAHIDQCLSGETTTKWTANPMVMKPRIKPRRMRSMVDIYATARHCTLEELDRRNGTNWASGSCVPPQEIEICVAERKQKSPVNLEDTDNDGAVYVDANGTKLRILSKFADLPSPEKIGEQSGPRRFMKGDKGSKLLLTKKKKKKYTQKHPKFEKYAPTKKISSPKPHHHNSQINDGREQNIHSEEIFEKEEAFASSRKAHDHVKFSESGTIAQWACSKRTGLMKKVNDKDDHRHSGCPEKIELEAEINESSPKNSLASGDCVLRSKKSFRKLPSSPKTNMNLSSEHEDGRELHLRKRAKFLSKSPDCFDQNSSLASVGKEKKLRESGSSVKRSNKDVSTFDSNLKSSQGSQRDEMKRVLKRNAEAPVVNSKQFGCQPLSSKAESFSSLRKNYASAGQATVSESKFSLKRKRLVFNDPRFNCASESEEEEMVPVSGAKTRDYVNADTTRVLKARKNREKIVISRKEEAMVTKGSKPASKYHEHNDGDKFDSSHEDILASVADGKESAEVQPCEKDIASKPASGMPFEGGSTGISKSQDVQCHKLAGHSDVRPDSREFVKIYDGSFLCTVESSCPVEQILGSGEEVVCADGGEKDNIGEIVYMRTEMDSDGGSGNYYMEVDPIPIPGPPGSFLPSPGRMASEEFQGNSSLTSSQVQSSEDHHDFANRDSSDSPSATSTISNSGVAKYESSFLEKLPFAPHNIQDGCRSSVSGATLDAIVNNSTKDQCAEYGGVESSNPVELKGNVLFPETIPFRFTNDQPCCCSRKEGVVLGTAALNYQESPLLRRRTMFSVPEVLSDKQVNGDATRKLFNSNFMSEVVSSGHPAGAAQNANINPFGHIPNKASGNIEVKFPVNSDGESASPSTSNPVLRLMGKDLMVVKKDEIVSPQLRPSQSPLMKNHENQLSYTTSGVYSGNIQNEEFSSHPVVSQSFNFEQTRGNTETQHVDVMLSNGYNIGNYAAPQRSTHASPLVLSGRSVPTSWSGSLESLDYMGDCVFPREQNRAPNRLSRPLNCDTEKAIKTPGQGQNLCSSDQTGKVLIVIDDAPNTVPDLATNAMHDLSMVKVKGSSASKSVLVNSGFSTRHADPFYGYKPPISSSCGGSPQVQSSNFQMPPLTGVSSSSIKWNCIPEGLQGDSFSSSSSAHTMRSSVYHSRGFS